MMSSMCSMPTDMRMRSLDTPAVANSSSLSWRWVVDAGWQASVLASPMLTNLRIRLSESMKVMQLGSPPLMPKESMPDACAFGDFFAEGVVLVICKACVAYPFDFGVVVEVGGECECILAVSLNAEP